MKCNILYVMVGNTDSYVYSLRRQGQYYLTAISKLSTAVK